MSHPNRALTILVGGMVAAVPQQGGATWAVLQYLLGLRRLGHSVFFVETVHPASLRPSGVRLCESLNARYTRDVMVGFGFGSSWAVLVKDSNEVAGASLDEVMSVIKRTDILINLGGTFTAPCVIDRVPTRVYVDLDPGFTQLWHDSHGIDMGFDMHNHFVTVGQAIGKSDCPIPTCGRHWITTVPPVVLDQWAPTLAIGHHWSTVANWRSYGSVEQGEDVYGQKVHSWRNILKLPGMTNEAFDVAIAIDPGDASDVTALRSNGWSLIDPEVAAGTPHAYREFIRGSKAEICIAKSGYVLSGSGWFSDRSACYLSSGRPVVAQETGFSSFIPTGEGLEAFATADGAREAIARVNRSYARHSRESRRLAENVFDSDKVLNKILHQVGILA